VLSLLERQARWYEELLPLSREIVVDAGANVGVLSQFFALAAGGRNRVLSIEPLDENAHEIEARIASLGANDRWSLSRCALSSRDGSLVLRVGRGEAPEATALNSAFVREGPGALSPDERRVPCKTLATLCADATVVKLDIEGHEYEVLDQALPTMHTVKAWAIELHMREDRPLSRTIAALRAAGYRVFGWCSHRAPRGWRFIAALRAAGYRVFGAGRRRSDPEGAWITAEVPLTLEWSMVPVAATRADGSVFKMLHIVALRG
jgi:FkbM family methyltransferase